jgi:hypothetical protein
VRDGVDHVARELVDVRGARDLRLEAERRALDRGVHVRRRDFGQDIGDLLCVDLAFVRAPVGLVDVLLDDAILERPVRERVDRVQVHVVLLQEILEPLALVAIAR